ncbi:MAG TPA: helix-turn-helix domain-containing protein, partial [Candidatus Baltobacteraceae bacterium]|nr:helix-turn-helix domain-containing protein [Candidatus Baltobacteraceae bacterium]
PSVVVAPPGRCRVVGISLEPQGACALIGAPVRQLLDVTVDLRDTLGAASHELGTRCALAAQTSSWNPERNAVAVVSEAAQWALRRIERGLDVDAVVHRAERIIRQQRGVVSVDALGTALGLSRPRFAQRFRERIGVTPKRFARMVRFHSALEMLGRSSSIALTASELAYYDQAHMHRDFEEFAGMTPGAFLQARRYGESASLAEP